MNLRPYQERIIEDARAAMRAGRRSLIITSPTGSGKTVLAAYMLKRVVELGRRCLFVVHRRELLQQSCRAFTAVGVDHGIIASGEPRSPQKPVQIATVQTLVKRLSANDIPYLVLWDECHHNAAGTYKKIYSHYATSYHVGLTATPMRLDGQGLREFFSDIIHGPSVRELISQGYLSPYRAFTIGAVATQGIHRRCGDYVRAELEGLMGTRMVIGNVVAKYQHYCGGQRAIVFSPTVEHAHTVAISFNKAGIPALAIDGQTIRGERDDAIRRFASGDVRVLCNCELFTEGFDVPSVAAVICMRPTLSFGLWRQMCGRALRPMPGKECAYILDHSGNIFKHGLPDDDVIYSLDGVEKKPREGSIRECPHCFYCHPVGCTTCKYCGQDMRDPNREGRDVTEVDGELHEVDREALKRMRAMERSSANSLEELTQLGIKRGYKNPKGWAWYVYSGRKRKHQHSIRGI